jgi:hypothetical protein
VRIDLTVRPRYLEDSCSSSSFHLRSPISIETDKAESGTFLFTDWMIIASFNLEMFSKVFYLGDSEL